jgi:hypothetical protein
MTNKTENRVGFYSALATAILTAITFGFAMIAIPISGANCPGDCVKYPYLDTVSQFPRDFVWMFFAILLILSYVMLMVALHSYAAPAKKIFSQIGLVFAILTAAVLLVDYFVQFSVVPTSLMHAETEGIPLLIQYNSHGVFLALEDLGYLLMSFSFLFMAPVFANKGQLETAIRSIFIIAFVVVILFLLVVSINYGLNRQDRFEVVALSVDWLVLIINGILLSILFKRRINAEPA